MGGAGRSGSRTRPGAIIDPAVGLVEAFARSAKLPALWKLSFDGGDLRGERAKSLVALRCGDLVELRFRRTEMRPVDLKVLLTAPWARRLEVVSVEKSGLAIHFNKVIDKSLCAKTLRIRRVG